jgi:hypothetical protein
MDVYLVPVGPERYELYCESADEAPVEQQAASGGRLRWFQERFGQVLAAVEREYEREWVRRSQRRHHHDAFFRRLRARVIRWVAERVAEQRLLWRLRGQVEVRAYYPSNLRDDGALRVIRNSLSTDSDRHSRWLVFDGVCLLLSGLLAPFPGPNMLAYYFTFRVVGHFLAIRGARQGLRTVVWRLQPSAALGRLCDLRAVPPAERLEHVRGIERELGLTRLARFFERIVAAIA